MQIEKGVSMGKKIKLKLDDDVPLPLSETELKEVIDWSDWKIGQSRFFPGEGYEVKKIAMAARAWGREHGRVFTAATRPEPYTTTGEKPPPMTQGVRIWRKS
jgi:hypothetical protein